MADVWQRHVVGKLEGVVPRRISVHHGRSEAVSSERLRISVNLCGARSKLLFGAEQLAVVIQSVYANLASGLADRFHQICGNSVSPLGNQLKRRPDSVFLLQFQHRVAKILASARLHIVCHNSTGIIAPRPIPDEGHLRLARSVQHKHPQLGDKILDRRINRPGGKWYLRPILQGSPLEDPANGHTEQRS